MRFRHPAILAQLAAACAVAMVQARDERRMAWQMVRSVKPKHLSLQENVVVTFSYNCIYKSKMARLVRSFTIYKVTPLKKVIAMLNEGKWTALSTGYTN